MPIRHDTYLGELTHFALLLPTDLAAYSRNPNPLRDFLLDLADCARASSNMLAERKAALMQGRKVYATRTATPAQARAVADNAAHG